MANMGNPEQLLLFGGSGAIGRTKSSGTAAGWDFTGWTGGGGHGADLCRTPRITNGGQRRAAGLAGNAPGRDTRYTDQRCGLPLNGHLGQGLEQKSGGGNSLAQPTLSRIA